MVLLDASALIDSLSEARQGWPRLRALVNSSEQVGINSLALYEWLRGRRTQAELQLRLGLFPDESVLAFGAEEAAISAELFRSLPRARARSTDIAIAASCLRHHAKLWTLNVMDFADIPGLELLA